MIQLLKSLAIKLVDKLDDLKNPYSVFSRPAYPAHPGRKLHDMEQEFFTDLIANFRIRNGHVFESSKPLDGSVDMGDQATYHGILTGMLAMKYAFTQDHRAILEKAVQGMKLHQTAHGEDRPRLIRGVGHAATSYQDDASNDTATGHLFGIWAVWQWGPSDLREVCRELVTGLADEILDHGHALVRHDGSPTTYGALEQGWKTDPLRITLALALYRVAHTVTQDPKYRRAYVALFTRYRPILAYPKVRLWSFNNNSDTHRAAIQLQILKSGSESPQEYAEFAQGLSRLREMVSYDGNVWVNGFVALESALSFATIDPLTMPFRSTALTVLSEFDLEKKQFNDGIDMYERTKGENHWPWFKPVKWGGTWKANQPLPRHMVMSHDFVWAKDLHSLDVGKEGKPRETRIHAGDWLCAYWISRLTGALTAQD